VACKQAGHRPAGSPRGRACTSAVTAAALSLPMLLSAVPDPLVPYLADDYDEQRLHLKDEIERLAAPPCEILSTYSGHRNDRVRENAVRALGDAGCRDFASYRPYLADPNPWVIERVLRAAQDQLMPEMVPFLLDRLSDPRRILAADESWTIGERAHQVLRMITCQSFHFDPQGSPRSRQDAVTRWRQWYEAHRGEPRQAWVEAGIALGTEYAGRDYAPSHRREGLELLALIGAPALRALRTAFARGPADLSAVVACRPDEPPRVNERIPCVLEIRNDGRRRVAFAPAPDGVDVRVARIEGSGATPPQSSPRAAAASSVRSSLPELASLVVDIGPGESLKRDFSVGPVPSAGRYEVRVSLRDLAGALFSAADGAEGAGKAGSRASAPGLPPIEAVTVVRFEQ
jgi:hypothetical protein